MSLMKFSQIVLETLQKFIASSDDGVDENHVPAQAWNGIRDKVEIQAMVVREARKIWEKMKDCDNKKVLMSDDGYLKLFQLCEPCIENYDCILVDEAQDLTPAIVALITSQTCSKIFVGDPHQQIYGFRGAINALDCVQADQVFYMTESFRFGPEIAYVAACVLRTLKGVWRQTLVGTLDRDRIDGAWCGQVAILAQRNATLFDEMVKVVREGRKHKLAFAGGIDKYDLDMYMDIHRLMNGDTTDIKNKLIKKFDSFDKLKTYADKREDRSLNSKIMVCETYRGQLPSLIEMIKSRHCKKTFEADIVFSTVHKSKGLEFDTVQIADDLVFSDSEQGQYDPFPYHMELDVETKNLIYVAVTRAKKSLILSPTLARILKREL